LEELKNNLIEMVTRCVEKKSPSLNAGSALGDAVWRLDEAQCDTQCGDFSKGNFML
jgi:hypothetical protein